MDFQTIVVNGVYGPEELDSSACEVVAYEGVLGEGYEVWYGLFSVIRGERDEDYDGDD